MNKQNNLKPKTMKNKKTKTIKLLSAKETVKLIKAHKTKKAQADEFFKQLHIILNSK